MLAQPRQIHHEGVLELAVDGFFDLVEVLVRRPFGKLAAENLLPVGSPFDLLHPFAGDRRTRPGRWSRFQFGGGLQVLVVKVERLVIVVDLGQVGIAENLGENLPFVAHLGVDLAAVGARPSAVPLVLVLPFPGITDAGLGLDIVEPGVFHAFAVGPHVLAGHRTGVAADALVEIEHHSDLRADFHQTISSASGAGRSSQSMFSILRTMTNSSRLEPTVP